MSPSKPFVDPETGTIDTAQVVAEAIPLARLVGLVAAVALVPLVLAFLTEDIWLFGAVFAIAGQFALAVGSGIVLIYAIVRGIHLADE